MEPFNISQFNPGDLASLSDVAGADWGKIAGALGGGQSSDSGVASWLRGFFTLHTAIRFVAVIIGVIIILICLYALLQKTSIVQSAQKQAGDAAKSVAQMAALAS